MSVGAVEGITLAFDKIERTPNTLDAHRLIRLAGERGAQDAVVEALFRAYFTEARDISDRKTLLDVVAGAGLERDRAEAELNSEVGSAAIRAEDVRARRLGVEGVPFFVVNGELALSGASRRRHSSRPSTMWSGSRAPMAVGTTVRSGARTVPEYLLGRLWTNGPTYDRRREAPACGVQVLHSRGRSCTC